MLIYCMSQENWYLYIEFKKDVKEVMHHHDYDSNNGWPDYKGSQPMWIFLTIMTVSVLSGFFTVKDWAVKIIAKVFLVF